MGAEPSKEEPARCVINEPPSDENCGPVYISSIRNRENGGKAIHHFRSQPDAKTPIEVLYGTCVKYQDDEAFGEREVLEDGKFGPYRWIGWNEFKRRVIAFAAALQSIGVKKGDSIGIYSHDCLFWQITQFAAYHLGAVIVPVYDSLGPNAASYIIDHADIHVMVAHAVKLESSITLLEEPNTKLQTVICITNQTENLHEKVLNANQLLEDGFKLAESFTPVYPDEEDIAVIMYTSGSTGQPKGCLLSHGNLVAGGCGLADPAASITHSDTYISFLPLAHIYELCSQMCFIAQGCRIGFYTGDVRNLMADVQELRPTMMLGVPRVFNRVAEAMMKKIDEMPSHVKWLVRSLIKMKSGQLLSDKGHSFVVDYFLFGKFAKALGGRIRLIVSGGAPIRPDVYEFLRAAITPNIIQGYGLTEIAAAGCIQEVGSKNPLAVGPVSIATDIKLRRVEGMDYDPYATPPSGEIMFRGPSIFKGYHKNEALTKEELVDGWFATGDIGILTSDGHIQIVDRAKQLVKLSQGEYISISTLNEAYAAAEGVSGVFVYADSHHNHPIAVAVPTDAQAEKWKAAGIEDYTTSKVAADEIMAAFAKVHQSQGLRGFERIGAVILDDVTFSIDNGLLTPSMKPQLSKLRAKYEARLVDLYSQHPELMQ